MKLKLILLVGFCAFGFTTFANAGVINDLDGDTIPDVLDNCTGTPSGSNYPNGPAEAPNNQIDSDGDGFGNRCDADFNNTEESPGNAVGLADLNLFLASFSGAGNNQFDLNYDGNVIDLLDLNIFLALFSGPQGGS